MLQVLSSILIGRYFAQLASKTDRDKFACGICAGLVTLGLTYSLSYLLQVKMASPTNESNFSGELTTALLGTVIGCVIMTFFYKIFERNWKKNIKENNQSADLQDNSPSE